MIPVYSAIEFIKEMEGGSTRPWQVIALVNGKPVPFVVKLYSEMNNEQNCTVLKECICSTLVSQFDLETPLFALIDFSKEFKESLPAEQKAFLGRKDRRLKFATVLLNPPYQNFSPALDVNYLKTFDLATIYALDNLILNLDRRVDKSNIILKDKSAYLIDHELTLATSAHAIIDVREGQRWQHNYKRHIFYSLLKQQYHTSNNMFDTFDYYLENLTNLKPLFDLAIELETHDHPVHEFNNIIEYIKSAKLFRRNFVNLLKATLHE